MKVKGSFLSLLTLLAPLAVEAQEEGAPTPEVKPKVTTEQTASVEPANAVSADKIKTEYKPGWVVNLYRAPKDLVSLPPESFGSFVVSDSNFRLNKHLKNDSLSFVKDKPGYLYEGWFHAKKEGRHVFMATIDLPIVEHITKYNTRQTDGTVACAYSLEIEGVPILQDNAIVSEEADEKQINLIGSVELQPGLYKAKQWLACQGSRPYSRHKDNYKDPTNDKPIETDDNPVDEVSVTLRLKEPGASIPRPAGEGDFLHRTSTAQS